MLRKHILIECPTAQASPLEEKDIAALATVLVTSETVDHPIDHVFDTRRGPGGRRPSNYRGSCSEYRFLYSKSWIPAAEGGA
jgi:hypothetical protein